MNRSDGIFDVCVIGAGAAGLMASVAAASRGRRVICVEKNRLPGKKLLLSGKKRCNITNDSPDTAALIDAYGKNGRFLRQALDAFGIEDTIGFVNDNGLRTVTGRGRRVFPETGNSRDVLDFFLRLMKERGAVIAAGVEVNGFTAEGGIITGVRTSAGEIIAENYILCTGGLSFPGTGSTGDGLRWASEMGHRITGPAPALVPLVLDGPWPGRLNGLALRNVNVSLWQEGKKRDERFGEAEFDATGIAGPVVLDMSKRAGGLLESESRPVVLSIDLKPALDHRELDARLLRDFAANSGTGAGDVLMKLLPAKIIPLVLETAHCEPGKMVSAVTRAERKRLVSAVKDTRFVVTGTGGFGRAIVTAGGVALKEVDPVTMRSKIVKNLFFAGEVLDLDGPTGGYNLQVCWSTGHAAGMSV